jgi:signal transduction histidine kinase
MRRAVALRACVAIWLACACAGLCMPLTAAAQPAFQWSGTWIRQAELAERGQVESVELPDNWNRRVAGRAGIADYNLQFELQLESDIGVYVPRLSRKADVLVNGIPATTIGRRETPVLPTWNEPQFFGIPPLLVAEGDNVLTFRLTAEERSRAGLSAVFVGPREIARQMYERRLFWQQSLPRFFEMLVLLVAAALTCIWLMKRNETFIGWFALCAWMWSVRIHQMFLPELGLSAYQSEMIAAISVHGSQLAEVISTLRLRGLRMRRLEALLLTHFALGAGLLLASSQPEVTASLLRWIYLPLTVVAYAFNVALVVHAWRQRSRSLLIFSGLIMLAMSFGLYDFLVVVGVLAFDSIFLMRFGGPLMVLALAGLLIGRYVASLRQVEKLNVELEVRIAEKSRELEGQYQRSRSRELELSLLAERDRFARDIHDGIGSRLIAAKAALLKHHAGNDDLRRVLEDCLADLRLIIDSFDPNADSLDVLLGDFRYKSLASLSAAFGEVDWRVDQLSDCKWLGAQRNLVVLRALQEMLGNALKHGAKSRVAVVARCDASGIELCVENALVEPQAVVDVERIQVSHRGLAGLERRARDVGGTFSFSMQGGLAQSCLKVVRQSVEPSIVEGAGPGNQLPTEPALSSR